jgi:hypothetical protein
MRVYYARAVDNRDWDEVQSERSRVLEIFARHGMEVINQFSNGFTTDRELVDSQIANIRRCDILVADLSIPEHPYIGCIGEIIYAHQFGKRVYVIYGGCPHISKRPWLSYHVDGFFKDYGDLLEHIGNN